MSGRPLVSGFGFHLGDYALGPQEKTSPIIPPVPRLTKPNPTPARTSKPPPPTATSLLKTGDTFLPTYLSYSPLRSWSPILKGAKFGVHPSHLGCRRKPPQSHRWPLSSRLAQGVGSALGRGDPHKRAEEGVPPLPVRTGDTPPNPSQPIRVQLGGRGSCNAPVRFPQHYIPHPI